MGEIADSLIDGEFDYISGEYIGPGVGYPRSYHDRPGRKKRYGKNNTPNLSNNTQIVWHFMAQRGIDIDDIKSRMTKAYGLHLKMESQKTSFICDRIRETADSWSEFKKWFDNDNKIPIE